ncbi:DUF2637 domain-containing protein [Micromonospora lupini]|uniref:DUF2637 domain-containing protein n=1 Tax=Micromonospora lupini TaxID=285679 RepID=UPI0022530301|nr:DUF2637 domain-containing protein [Micromonospora lupini]MCX5066690.1 DUF2637 domain-containing protein [Micromonospora lupini]
MTLTAEHTTTPGLTVASAADTPLWRQALDAFMTGVDYIPAWAWLLGFTVLTTVVLVLRSRAAKAIRAAGRASTGKTTTDDEGEEYGALFKATVTAAVLFWVAVLAGSFRSLIEFAEDTLHWKDGWQFLVPATLDGVAVTFGFLAFLAIKRKRSPARAYRVVWGATIASALINFTHEAGAAGGSALGGGYFALLSLFGMAILHELLDLFGEGAALVIRVNPVFGIRWVTWPSNTAAAWLAWRNHPPRPLRADPTDEQKAWYGSVRHAVAHLEAVRRAKRIARYRLDVPAAALPAAGWARIWPWLRVRQLDTALTDLRQTTAEERTTLRTEAAEAQARLVKVAADELAAAQERFAADLARVHAELDRVSGELAATTDLFNSASAELDQAHANGTAAEARATTAEADADRARTDATAARQTAADRADEITRLAGELRAAQHDSGRLAARLDQVRADADRAAADALRQLDVLADRHAAELSATTERLARERDAAVEAAHASAAASRPVSAPAGGAHGSAASGQPASAGRSGGERSGGGSANRSPSSPPWSAQQERAFKLRDADKKKWTFDAIAAEVGAGESSVRRWFDNRRKHLDSLAAVPTSLIPAPKEPALSGTNGTPVTR